MMNVRRLGRVAAGMVLGMAAMLMAGATDAGRPQSSNLPDTPYSPRWIANTSGVSGVSGGGVDAITIASQDLRMSFTVSGLVRHVAVKAGDRVKAGDLLIALEDSEGQAMILQYQLKAHSDLAVRSAREQLKLAQIEAKAIEELFDTKAATPIELDRARAKAAVAELEVEHADQQTAEARHLLAQAIARHDRYELRAPIDGVIDTLIAHEGESVESLKPVLRLVDTDKLHIDASVPTHQTMTIKPGDPAWVQFRILPDQTPVQGRILYLAQVADSASDTRIVRIETPNPHGLPAGVGVTVMFEPPTAQAESSSGSASHTARAGE